MGPAAEQLADALAQDANNMKLLSGDPVKAVLSRLEGAEHRDMLQASMILFQRFCDTETLPELGKLSSIVRESMQPTLAKFEKHLTTRRAFQAASTLTPLLSRAATLATQCCALAIRGPWSHGVVLPLCEAVSDLAEVFNVAIMARAELCRPFDAPRIYASHRRFADLEATASRAVSMCSPVAGNISRTLAPLPPKPEHHWRYDQLRQFWSSSCSHKFLDGAVPIDELAILLLQAAGAEVSLAYREALMRRLHGASLRFPGKVCADELDCCSAEIRRNGGLKAWVHAVVLGGDLSKTAALKGGSTVSPRPGERPFLLTATLRKPETESSLTDVVAQGLLKASQRLILGDKVSPDSRDAHGDTALHLAASLDFKHGSLGALLLSNGADINAQATPPEDDDDDMPPLEYVGADASLGISLREGDSVILKGLSKTALNGQTGTLQSFQKASKGRLPVKLDKSGSMLAVKPENIEKINTKVGGIPNHGVASAKATHVDRNASPPPPDDDDDELPPLEYVGEITNGTAEHGTGQMSDADDMPSLEYFGTSKPSGPNHSKDSQPSVSKPSPPYAEARATGAPKEVPAATEKVLLETPVSTFRPGDQVLIKGTTKQLDGQQGIIESIKDGTCFVRLEKNKDVLQLGEANLHKIWLRGSGAGAMPPLQMVGQAGSAPLYSAPNGQNGTTEVERIKAPAESKAPRSSQGNRQETQDALQKMRSALHATASHEVDDALRLAETPGMAWGEWETEKTQILKQLRTKRSQIVEVRPQESQEVSRTVKKSTIETWCEELQLPQKLLARLNEEDVTDPEELTGVGETELAALTSGLKIGPKGRFMKAVKRMKALEAAELGSAVSLS